MSLTPDTIRHVASLARLSLTEEEIASYATEVSGILAWIDQLQAVPTDGVPMTTSNAGFPMPFREDCVTDGGCQEDILANAPKTAYGCFVVPKVVE